VESASKEPPSEGDPPTDPPHEIGLIQTLLTHNAIAPPEILARIVQTYVLMMAGAIRAGCPGPGQVHGDRGAAHLLRALAKSA
jgi:hypothetical protein